MNFGAGVRLVQGNIDEGAAGARDIGSHRWIATASLALQHIRSGQKLRRVTDGCDELVGLAK